MISVEKCSVAAAPHKVSCKDRKLEDHIAKVAKRRDRSIANSQNNNRPSANKDQLSKITSVFSWENIDEKGKSILESFSQRRGPIKVHEFKAILTMFST